MKKIKKSSKSVILLLSLVLGAIVGLIFKEQAAVLSPLGDLFINMMFVVIVPLIFLTITTSISKMESPKMLGKVLTSIVMVFAFASIVALIIGFLGTFKTNLVNPSDSAKIIASLNPTTEVTEKITVLDKIVQSISVTDFSKILSKDNLIALIVISLITGIAIRKSGKKGIQFKKVLESANEVLMKIIEIIMLYAPIGLGCYFAALVGTFGGEIALGYLKTFILYTVIAILFYVIIYTLYAYLAAGKSGVKKYWQNIIPATITSLVTCSSAASIPVNTECAKKIGVPADIAETTIPLGTSFHKDGSIIGSFFKIMFLVCLFGTSINSFGEVMKVFGVAFIANLLITAVPIGGGTISEMMIITLMA